MLVDIPLENRERSSPLKKLCTAVSRESPDLFRIHGVPCIDRGPDKSGPPVAYEHWNDSGRGGIAVSKWQQEGEDIKKTPNYARPSSVSADTPNFFKVRKLCEICMYGRVGFVVKQTATVVVDQQLVAQQ